jgi:hypothetical protein
MANPRGGAWALFNSVPSLDRYHACLVPLPLSLSGQPGVGHYPHPATRFRTHTGLGSTQIPHWSAITVWTPALTSGHQTCVLSDQQWPSNGRDFTNVIQPPKGSFRSITNALRCDTARSAVPASGDWSSSSLRVE